MAMVDEQAPPVVATEADIALSRSTAVYSIAPASWADLRPDLDAEVAANVAPPMVMSAAAWRPVPPEAAARVARRAVSTRRPINAGPHHLTPASGHHVNESLSGSNVFGLPQGARNSGPAAPAGSTGPARTVPGAGTGAMVSPPHPRNRGGRHRAGR